jgi:hypothetical protein
MVPSAAPWGGFPLCSPSFGGCPSVAPLWGCAAPWGAFPSVAPLWGCAGDHRALREAWLSCYVRLLNSVFIGMLEEEKGDKKI